MKWASYSSATRVLKIRPTKTNFMYRRLLKQFWGILGIFTGLLWLNKNYCSVDFEVYLCIFCHTV